ncbi:hypothetical protein D3C75_610870 [compost metagenome]
MVDVPHPFSFQLNWYPSYSYTKIPDDWEGDIPGHWHILTESVDPEKGIPEFRHVSISNVTVTNASPARSIALEVEAYGEKPLWDIQWKNVSIEAGTSGYILNAQDWTMDNVVIRTADQTPLRMEQCVNVPVPHIGKLDS